MNLFSVRIYLSKFYKIVRPIRGINNSVVNKAKTHRVKFDIVGDNNIIIFEKGLVLNSTIYIRGNNNKLTIGQNCQINKAYFLFEDSFGQITIGDNSTIESANFQVVEHKKSITIGKDCMFSTGINLNTSDSHSIVNKHTGERLNYSKDIIIGDHVWLGRDVTVLKGVIIDSNSIVGTKSLVTKNIDKNSIYAGIPANKIKSEIDWKRDKIE